MQNTVIPAITRFLRPSELRLNTANAALASIYQGQVLSKLLCTARGLRTDMRELLLLKHILMVRLLVWL